MRLLCFLVSLAWTYSLASCATPVVVVTVATEEKEGLRRLVRSARSHGVEVNVYGLGEKWTGGEMRTGAGGGQKIRILREKLKEYKDDKETLIVFTDGYDIVWQYGIDTLVDRFLDHFPGVRILFGAEPFCWPREDLAQEYPLVEFGKRFLNSGMFVGYAADVYKMLTVKEVADTDDDQLYYTMIYLDKTLRKNLKMALDSQGRIFQNLNGVVDDVQLEIDEDDGKALAYNMAYNTHPVILHGNGPSEIHLSYLANYVAGEWNSQTGCARCNERKEVEKEEAEKGESVALPTITIGVFITKTTPFVQEVLEALADQDYPKSKMHLFVYNNQPFYSDLVLAWTSAQKGVYLSRQVINNDGETGERDARQTALDSTLSRGSQYFFSLDGDIFLHNGTAIRSLVGKSEYYDTDILSPVMNQPGKLFSNFWGALSDQGWYARSEDYIPIIQGKRLGLWNVPFVSSPVLLKKSVVTAIAPNKPFHYNKDLDSDMSFASYLRHHGHYFHVSNEDYAGFLVEHGHLEEEMTNGRLHPEMWQIFYNRFLWERRYLHPDYQKLLQGEIADIPQPCPDVFDYALISERFAAELIEEMEHFGQWSDGSNQDNRLTGGYENVPTRDIHMNQVGFDREWLFFLDEYVRPMQEKVFEGYFHKPVESNMMFVVRYKPDEQASLRPHHDASTFSIDIALNKRDVDYEGGGVRFTRYNCTVPADEVGHTMMFPGRLTHMHEGLPTVKGTRYILVSFINP